MPDLLAQAKQKRSFVSKTLTITSWNDIEPYFVELRDRVIRSVNELEAWLRDRSELDAVLEEDLAWRYIKMNCHTENTELAESFNTFVSTIEPEASKYSNLLDEKFTACPFLDQLDEVRYFTFTRSTRNKMEIFRESNLQLNAELQQESQEYGVICSKQLVEHAGKEYTLQQAAVFLKETNRELREEIFRKTSGRRLADARALDDLLTRLVSKRNLVARNAGFPSYTEYRFKELGRFDYTREDCFQFHESIKKEVVPVVKRINEERQAKLALPSLRPWDMDVDPDGLAALKPFADSEDLLDKSIACFSEIDPAFGGYLKLMRDNKYLDLDSRKAKAPGGFNYPLYESNAPFIYMNSAGTLRDVETMVHEGGHAVHSFLSSGLELVDFKSVPSEVAELASMSMELISMEHWHHFFPSPDELKRAKRSQLESVIAILPWIATVDKFQFSLYEDGSTPREEAWIQILDEFSDKTVDWTGLEHIRENSWQKQLHIFEVPFYYIEYAISQLGAISLWRNYKQNPRQTIRQYKEALSLGYTVPIRKIYETAGIKFDFSAHYVSELMRFVSGELAQL